jgi:hypothetical protein
MGCLSKSFSLLIILFLAILLLACIIQQIKAVSEDDSIAGLQSTFDADKDAIAQQIYENANLTSGDSTGSIYFNSGINLYSPINQTYYSPFLTLNLTLRNAGYFGDVDPRVSMHYNIDGEYSGAVPLVSDNVIQMFTRAIGRVDLPELSNGSHCLTLYLYGYNQRSHNPEFLPYMEKVYFSIDYTINSPTPSPTITPSPTPTPGGPTSNPPIPGFVLVLIALFLAFAGVVVILYIKAPYSKKNKQTLS